MTRVRPWLLCAFLLSGALPQSAFASVWGDLPVPGGVPAMRRAIDGLRADHRPDALWLQDFIRRTLSRPTGDADVDRVREYLAYLAELKAATAGCPERCRLLPSSAPGAERDRVRRLLDVLGLTREGNREVTRASDGDAKQRHVWLAALGLDPEEVASTLNTAAPLTVTITDGVLPLPLPDYFAKEVMRPDREPLRSILEDHKSALLYLGLMGAASSTLKALEARPALLRDLHHDHAAAFVVVSASLRLTDSGMELPGGADTALAWEELAGRKPADGDRFLRAVLSNDSGRLAYFFSMVGQFDAPRQAFVMGGHLTPRERARYVERLYRQFVVLDPDWPVLDRPLFRPDFDAFLALALVDIGPDGTVGPLWWPSLLERITGSTDWPDKPADTLRALRDRRADALWLMGWLFDDPKDAQSRFRILRFAQRQFASQPRTAAPVMEIALRSTRDMPALPRALERMGIGDPSIYHLLALAGRGLEGSGDARDLADLRRWQAALALVEQIDRRHPAPADRRVVMLSALASVGLRPQDDRPGAVAGWLTEQLLTVYAVDADDPADRERALITTFTTPSGYTRPAFTWEALDYVFDPASALTRGVLAIRNAARVPRLVDVAALHAARKRLETGFKSVDELRPVIDTLRGLSEAVGALPTINDKPHPSVAEYDEVLRNLTRLLTRPRDLNRVAREVPGLRRVIDDVADVAILSTTFALASVPTSDAAELFATRFTRHVFVPAATDVPSTAVAWTVARSEPFPAGGTILRGSLLGLDMAMAESLVRNPGTSIADAPPVVTDTERESILARIGVPATRGLDAPAFEGVVTAVANGRARLAAWRQTPPPVDTLEPALRRAGVADDLINAIVWNLGKRETDVLGELGAGVSFRLGGGRALPPAWGPVGVMAEACWCARPGLPVAREVLLGRRDGSAAATDEELIVRLAELLGDSRVPRDVLTAVLPFALFDWLDNIRQASPEDSLAVRAWPRTLDAARFEQYLLQLTAEGVFAAPKSGGVQ